MGNVEMEKQEKKDLKTLCKHIIFNASDCAINANKRKTIVAR